MHVCVCVCVEGVPMRSLSCRLCGRGMWYMSYIYIHTGLNRTPWHLLHKRHSLTHARTLTHAHTRVLHTHSTYYTYTGTKTLPVRRKACQWRVAGSHTYFHPRGIQAIDLKSTRRIISPSPTPSPAHLCSSITLSVSSTGNFFFHLLPFTNTLSFLYKVICALSSSRSQITDSFPFSFSRFVSFLYHSGTKRICENSSISTFSEKYVSGVYLCKTRRHDAVGVKRIVHPKWKVAIHLLTLRSSKIGPIFSLHKTSIQLWVLILWSLYMPFWLSKWR